MELLSRAWRALNPDDDALLAHRNSIRQNFSVLGALALLPFAAMHLVRGNALMCGINLVIGGVMLLNAWALHRGRQPVVPFLLLAALMVPGLFVSVWLQGIYGVLWASPALFLFFFVLSRRWALILGLLLLLSATAASMVSMGPPTALRVFFTLALDLCMFIVVLNVIGTLQRALETQASTDPLTGAYNRRHLQTLLAQRAAPLADAGPGPGDALLALDIDHFKRINDRHGHAAGDEVLRRLVNTVQARKRGSDLLFRTGGEEFVLLLPRVTLAAAQGVAEELRQRLEQAELLPGEPVTVSIGVSTLAPGQSAEAWFKAADAALYEAKRAGRNRVAVAPGA